MDLELMVSGDLKARASIPAPQAEGAGMFRLLLDGLLDYAIFLLTPDGHVASWNAGAERLKGYRAEEIIGHSFERFYLPEDQAAGRPARLLATARSEGRVEDEGWRVRKDGTLFWADATITALRDDTGRLVGFAKVTRDLTERRAADELLRQSEERFRTLVASVKDYAIFLLSPEGLVLTWNQGAQLLKGYAPEEIIGHSFERFYLPEDQAAGRPARLLATARAEGRVEDEGWRVRKDGTRFWADVVITALANKEGQLTGFAKVTRDLTERRQAEEDRARRVAAERAAERIDRLQVATAALAAASRPQHVAEVLADVCVRALGGSAGAVAFPTPEGESLVVSHITGAAPETLQIGDALGPDDACLLSYVWRTGTPVILSSSDQAYSRYPELTRLLTNSPYTSCAAIPFILDQHVVGVLGVCFDRPRDLDADEGGFLRALAEVGAQAIDRARLYESEQRARAEAEAAVRAQDEFLSLASHELRTPVAAVKATAQLAERAIERGQTDPARTVRYLRTIARSADRLGALVDDLLDVSRLRTGRLQLRTQALDLGPVLQEIVGRYGATATRHRFTLRLPEQRVVVQADPLRLEQVLDNLLSNAVKYSPAGGDINVGVCADGGGWTLEVADHGIGVPAGQETHIFEMFGRASNAASQHIQGMGLGLGICRQLVKAHGGRIWAGSPGEGQGTTIGVWLPDFDQAAGVADQSSG
jgi:PAS domain S-box-containing protein